MIFPKVRAGFDRTSICGSYIRFTEYPILGQLGITPSRPFPNSHNAGRHPSVVTITFLSNKKLAVKGKGGPPWRATNNCTVIIQ
jgi:hypothetical protein